MATATKTTAATGATLPNELTTALADWKKAMSAVTRSESAFLKAHDALRLSRVHAARALAPFLAHDAFKTGTGRVNKARIADALGANRIFIGRLIAGIELFNVELSNGAVREDTPTDLEVESINHKWEKNAKNVRESVSRNMMGDKSERTESGKGKAQPKAAEPAKGSEPMEAESVALSGMDLLVKLKELDNTVEALRAAKVELSDDEREAALNALAQIGAMLER